MGKFSGSASVQAAQQGQLSELDLPTGPQVEAAPEPEQAPPPSGGLMQALQAEAAPEPVAPSPEAQQELQQDVGAGLAAADPLAAEIERQSIPSIAERSKDVGRVDRWLKAPAPAKTNSISPDGGLRDRAKSMATKVQNFSLTPAVQLSGPAYTARAEGKTGAEIAEAVAAEKEGTVVAALHRANAIIKDPNGKDVPAPEYIQVASVVTENALSDIAFGEDVEGDPISEALEEQTVEGPRAEPIPITYAAGNGKLGQSIHQEFQRMQGIKVPEKLPGKEAETLGSVFKDMWATNNPDLVERLRDPASGQMVYKLTSEGTKAIEQGQTERKRLFPKVKVRPAKTPLPSGQLPGDVGQNIARKVSGSVGKQEFGNVIKNAMTNLAQVPNVVDKQRAKILYSTILPVLQSKDHNSWMAEINNFGPSKIQKFQAAAAQQDKKIQEAQAKGQDFTDDLYDPQANMEALTDKIAQEVQSIAKERNGANYLSYNVQGFQGRITPQQSFFDPTTSKAVRFVTRNAVPAIAKPGSRVERNLRQMYAMMLVKGADSKLPNAREIALDGATPQLEAWGDRLTQALQMTDAEYEGISNAIDQGLALDDPNFPQIKGLDLDPEADAELISKIESKGEDGPHFIDGLMDFAKYAKAKREGRPHNSYFNAYIDGKTNGLASNGIQFGHLGTAERTGVIRNNRKELLDDGDIRDELKKIAIESINEGWDGDTNGFESELNDVARNVFGHRDLNKTTTMTFGYGKEIESFGKNIEETIALLSEMKGGVVNEKTKPLASDPNQWSPEQKTDYLQWQRGKLKEESSYPGFDAEVLFHSSPAQSLGDFNFRPVNVQNKAAYGKGPGIFTHGASTDASKYGGNVYAVIYDKKSPTFAGKEDTSDTAIDEIFIPEKGVEELARIWPPGPEVVDSYAKETQADRGDPSGADSYNTSLSVVDEKMSRTELAETLLNKYEQSLKEVLSDDALKSRELMRGAAMLHSATNKLFSIKSYVGQDLNFGHDVSTGYDAAAKTKYKLKGSDATGSERTVAHYETEATSAAARNRGGVATPGEYAYGGSVVGPVQSLDAATVALTASGKSWDRLKKSSGNNPYMHTIYDAFKMDAMGYDVVMEEVNKNWLDATMKWSYLEETAKSTEKAMTEFQEEIRKRPASEKLGDNERLYMDWLLTTEESKSGKQFMKNYARKMQKVKDYHELGDWAFKTDYEHMQKSMRSVGYDVYNPPAEPTVAHLRQFTQTLAKQLDLRSRLNKTIKETNDNKKKLKQEILKKGYKTPSGERIALQYYAH